MTIRTKFIKLRDTHVFVDLNTRQLRNRNTLFEEIGTFMNNEILHKTDYNCIDKIERKLTIVPYIKGLQMKDWLTQRFHSKNINRLLNQNERVYSNY